ncbi:MAG: aromatic amino acid transport family protein [Lachnospiraceae bacterium]
MSYSKTSKLTFLESVGIIAGTGIGSGVMAIPLLFKEAGIIGGIIAFSLAFIVSIFMHFIMADIVINSGTYEVTSIFNKLLLHGKAKKALKILFFTLVTIMLISNLSAYILGGADVLVSLTGIPPFLAKFLFYAISVFPVFFGLKAIGIGEKYLVMIIIGLSLFFALISSFNFNGSIALIGNVLSIIKTFSMTMFSLTALFAVPEIVKGFNNDAKQIKKSISLGLAINLCISSLICFSVIVSSKEVTPMAAVGWSHALGSIMSVLSSVFILLAMITSFWVISIAFSHIINAQFKTDSKFCYIAATLPSLLIALIPFATFSFLAELASGAISLLIAFMMIPGYIRSAKLSGRSPLLGNLGKSKLFFAGIILGNLFMVIGSLF